MTTPQRISRLPAFRGTPIPAGTTVVLEGGAHFTVVALRAFSTIPDPVVRWQLIDRDGRAVSPKQVIGVVGE